MQAERAQKALGIRQWNKEEKARAKAEGRRPRLKEMPKAERKSQAKGKGKDRGHVEKDMDDEEVHRRSVRNGKRRVVEEEEPCSGEEGEEGEDEDGPRPQAKATRPTLDPDAKAKEVQKTWSNRLIEGKKVREARIRASMDVTQAEIREHCNRKWVSKENPDQMTRRRYELEKRYNPLFVMLSEFFFPRVFQDS